MLTIHSANPVLVTRRKYALTCVAVFLSSLWRSSCRFHNPSLSLAAQMVTNRGEEQVLNKHASFCEPWPALSPAGMRSLV